MPKATASRAKTGGAATHPPASATEDELRLLMQAIYGKYSYDFRDYTGSSQKRRVLQALAHFDCPSVTALQSAMLKDATFFMQLLQYLTIPVSDMFRDPTFFLALRQQVLPVLHTYPSLKIWIAGCSTGEEVYSLAILLREEGLLERSLIYATDINPQSLDKARRGIFPLSNIAERAVSYHQAGGKGALSDYYTAAYDAAIFDKSLLENITFADHSLATDSVFSETQLVLCRNVLIYFNKSLQDRALGLFHESLSHRGFLGLGSKESLEFSGHAAHFEIFNKPERIFRRLQPARA